MLSVLEKSLDIFRSIRINPSKSKEVRFESVLRKSTRRDKGKSVKQDNYNRTIYQKKKKKRRTNVEQVLKIFLQCNRIHFARVYYVLYIIYQYIYIRYEVTRKKRNRLHGGQCIVKRPCITRNREERVRATESNENVHRCIRFSFSFFPLFSSLSLFLILSAHDLSLPSNSLRRDESKAN